MRRRLLPRPLATFAALFLCLLVVASALAHADYDRSLPAADEVLSQAPPQVQVWFTQELFRREGMNSLEVYGPEQQRVDQADAAIDDDNRSLMTVSLQPGLPNGLYTVRWHTLSADDGDEADGEFRFTLRAADPTAGAPATASPGPEPSAAATTPQSLPANTPPAQNTEPETTPVADDAPSDSGESSSQQAVPSLGLPCIGGSAPLLLLLGAFLAGRAIRKKR